MDITRSIRNHLPLIVYVLSSSVLLTLIVTIQSYRHGVFGTRLLLGWDSPGYVWMAQDLIKNGPLHMIELWNFPQLYLQLLAFLGYLTENVVMIERVLPLIFGILLIYANYQLVLKVTKNAHVAGLAALLTVLSLNVLRLLADLHRNIMALSLVMISLLLVPNLENKGSFPYKRYLLFVVLLSVIACTQFETCFILSLSLVLYGCLTKCWKNAAMLTLACTIPVAILVLLFPVYFFGYASSVFSFGHVLTLDDFILWTGGSWILSGFFIISALLLFRRLIQRNERLVLLVFSYSLTIVLLVVSIALTRILPAEFAFRVLLLLPIPVLLALTVQALIDLPDSFFMHLRVFSAKRQHLAKINVRRLLLLIVVSVLVANSVIVSFQHIDVFLNPYIPISGYQKLLAASEFMNNNSLSQPVVVYYGSPAIWVTSLYRNYLGAELGEHFSYYGSVEYLFRLVPSDLKFKDDPSLGETERYTSTLFYNELLGNWSGLIPTTYSHQSYITSVETLVSHPILIITPEFYNENIPYYIRPFHIGEGIYVIPPHSLLKTGEVAYGLSVSVYRNGVIDWVRSEYLYADPIDPSLIILRVNGSLGYSYYNFTGIPPDWTFIKIEQGGDQSYPEKDPERLDGASAQSGNDPADSAEGWSSPEAGNVYADPDIKKEGLGSLKVVGTTGSSGTLGLRYDLAEIRDFSTHSLMAVWVKSTEQTAFCMTLHDSSEQTRTFWAIQVEGSSATTEWKRFVIDISNYTQQTPNFDITNVDFIDLYVFSDPGKEVSLWIDDLTIDDFPELRGNFYKARVLVEDTVILYFAIKEVLCDDSLPQK